MRTPWERFSEKYVEAPNGCWIWTANQSKGYGLFWLEGHVRAAHRVSYEMLVGPIPDGLTIDHLCRTPLCVNPAHMEPVTSAENTLRGMSMSARNARKTHCKNGHEFTPANIEVTNTGGRRCLICKRAYMRTYMREWYARNKAA